MWLFTTATAAMTKLLAVSADWKRLTRSWLPVMNSSWSSNQIRLYKDVVFRPLMLQVSLLADLIPVEWCVSNCNIYNIVLFVKVCGGHLQATTSVKHFYSHAKFGDHNYDNKEDCDWVIEAPVGKNVHLTFLTFELEDEHECGYDSVEVYQGFDDSGPSNGRYCGNRVRFEWKLCNIISNRP